MRCGRIACFKVSRGCQKHEIVLEPLERRPMAASRLMKVSLPCEEHETC